MNFYKVLMVFVFPLLLITNLFAVNSRDLLLKDYRVPVVIPKGKIEFDVDYLAINDTLDIFNVRDSSVSSSNPGSLGDLDGLNLMLNIGVLSSSMVHLNYSKSNIDYGFGTLKAKSMEVSFRYSFYNKIPKNKPMFSIDAGIKYDFADDITSGDVNIMDRYVKKFYGNNYRVYKDNTGFTIFENRVKGWQFGVRETPYIKIKDMKSYTEFFRLSAGKIYSDILSVLFLEVGTTQIDTKIDSDIKNYAFYKQYVDYKLPVVLNRDESYLELGADFFIKFPHKIVWNFRYSYKRMFRKKSLDYIKYNHIIDTEVDFYVTKHFSLNFGAKYMHRQFNGEIPYLYNKFTQTTFDHKYGYVNFGFTFLFGGEN